jgi:hypothetical protein
VRLIFIPHLLSPQPTPIEKLPFFSVQYARALRNRDLRFRLDG